MIITLYENCRLTKAYNEVFKSTFLEGYLNTLTKYSYILQEGDEVYLTNKGRCNLDAITQGNLKCNYMKVEDNVNNITRYFFIDDYDIVNGVAIVDYTEDVWATYSSKINIIKGDVSNLRYGIGSDIRHLPNDYISNNKLTISSLENNTSGKYNIILVLQVYTLVSGGELEDRNLTNVIITDRETMLPKGYSMIEAEELINQLLKYSSKPNCFNYRQTGETGYGYYNYEIVNAYFVPEVMLSNISLILTGLNNFTKGDANHSVICDAKEVTDGIYTKSKILNSNFKRYAIGTLDNFIEIDENGTSIKLEYLYSFDNNNFHINLKIGTSIIDVTSSFNYDLPINVQSADVTQQQAIARELKNRALDIQKSETLGKGINNIIGDVSKLAIGTGMVMLDNPFKGASMMVEASSSIVNSGIDMAYSLQKNDLNRWYTNYKTYKTGTKVNTGSNLLLNAQYGIIELIVVPDNENYINSLIEVVGYKTLKIVTDNSLLTTPQENKDYNIIKFNSVWMYGNFPHSIQLILEEILAKGFKIWFKSNV